MDDDDAVHGAEGAEPQRRPLSRRRRAVASVVSLSAQIPQFTLDRSLDLTTLAGLRQELRAAGEDVSYEDLTVAACARALRRHPELNASWDDDAIVEHVAMLLCMAGVMLLRPAEYTHQHGHAQVTA